MCYEVEVVVKVEVYVKCEVEVEVLCESDENVLDRKLYWLKEKVIASE